jgi:hypothetical protein
MLSTDAAHVVLAAMIFFSVISVATQFSRPKSRTIQGHGGATGVRPGDQPRVFSISDDPLDFLRARFS